MKKRVLFIQSGPCYSVKVPRNLFLSEYFEGDVLTFSDSSDIAATEKSYNFFFHCQKIKSGKNHIRNTLRYIFFCCLFCFKSRFFDNKKFDLVTTYDPLKTGLLGAIASKILSCKFVPEINGTYSSHFNYYDKSIKLSRFYAFLYTQIMKIVFTFANGIKYQYPGQIHFFEKHLGKRVVSNFPNLVQLDSFSNICENKEILIVGFPFWRKGIDIAIEAFKLISSEFSDWKLKILGWYPDLTLMNKYINGNTQIYHHKPVLNNEMPEHIGRAAIICCPSRSEGVPRVLMEAMMAEKPRIGSNVDGIPVVIQDNYDGLLFRNENIQELAEKMALLIRNPDLRKIMGIRGKDRVVSEFSKDQYVAKLVALYNNVLKN